ncbi:MAG TPA: hypothetical protein VJ019_05595, partial [Aestuariivirga sp.]|nr:hypothetical protein [Aestuariivirga sp.]
MKAFKFVSLLAVVALVLVACGGGATTQAPQATSAAVPTAAGVKENKDIKILVNMKGPGGGNPFWAAV